jgi:regulator of protease activity HflC (stomatin/prohibitin superfamily)
MAEIRRFPFLRHLRSEPTMHTLHYRRGRLVRSGRGLAFWFRPLSSGVAELPLDDRDVDFLFRARSADFQDVAVQGVVTFRIADPEALAGHVDFSVDLDSGTWLRTPIERLQAMLTRLAQQVVWRYAATVELRSLLVEGVDATQRLVRDALTADPQLQQLGVENVAVRVASLRPSADTEKALELPTRELIQQDADDATFRRRARAVETERAIQENELQNRIELARREEQLVTQEGVNRRRAAEEEAAAERIAAEGEAERSRIAAAAEAEQVDVVEAARARAERSRADVFAGLSPVATLALVARDAGGLMPDIDQLVITPDLLAGVAARLVGAGDRDG